MDKLLNRLNNHATAAFGATLFMPSLLLLANQDYAQKLVHDAFPRLNTDLVPLVAGLLVGFAGWLLYQSKPHNVADEDK